MVLQDLVGVVRDEDLLVRHLGRDGLAQLVALDFQEVDLIELRQETGREVC